NLALSYAFLGQFDAAEPLLANLARRRAGDPEVALAIATVRLYGGRTSDALTALKSAAAPDARAIAEELKRPPGEPPQNPGELAEAAARLDAVVQIGPQRGVAALASVRALFQLAQIRERQGNRAEALQLYARFAALWTNGDVDRDRVADAKSKS